MQYHLGLNILVYRSWSTDLGLNILVYRSWSTHLGLHRCPVLARASTQAPGCLLPCSFSQRRTTTTPTNLHKLHYYLDILLGPLNASWPAPTPRGGQLLLLLLYKSCTTILISYFGPWLPLGLLLLLQEEKKMSVHLSLYKFWFSRLVLLNKRLDKLIILLHKEQNSLNNVSKSW